LSIESVPYSNNTVLNLTQIVQISSDDLKFITTMRANKPITEQSRAASNFAAALSYVCKLKRIRAASNFTSHTLWYFTTWSGPWVNLIGYLSCPSLYRTVRDWNQTVWSSGLLLPIMISWFVNNLFFISIRMFHHQFNI
jgi:hypothetical protein